MRTALVQLLSDSESVLVGAGYAWAALMFALGALNIVIALTLPFRVWA